MEIVIVLQDSECRENDVSKYVHKIVTIAEIVSVYASQIIIEISLAIVLKETHVLHLVTEIVQVYVSVTMGTLCISLKINKWLVFAAQRVSIGMLKKQSVLLFVR